MNFLKQFDARTILAFLITLSAILGTTTLSWVVIEAESTENNKIEERAQLVFNAMLPLFGTWVGTVLAYYFARENFVAATDSTAKLATLSPSKNLVLQSILVRSAMIPLSKLVFTDRAEDTLSNLLENLEKKGLRRLPILEQDSQFPKSLVYYEDIANYYRHSTEAERDSLTLQRFLDDSEKGNITKPFTILKIESTLKTAKEKMEEEGCRDAFITETGQRNSVVLGYLTNMDIEKFSKL